MDAREIIYQIIEKNNSDVTRKELDCRESHYVENDVNYYNVEFGYFPKLESEEFKTLIVKEWGENIEIGKLKERCFRSLLDLILRKSLNL